MYRNLATALFLTEREDADLYDNAPKVKGRIITTLAKAKEIRPVVERCITLARKGYLAEQAAEEFGTQAERHTEAWKEWRKSDNYAKWVAARAPAVVVRRRLLKMLGSKEAVRIACSQVAERFLDRPGGYTRIMRLATPRLGDAGTRAILEFVGRNDRVQQKSEKPQFGGSDVPPTEEAPSDSAPSDENNSGSEPAATGENSDA